MNIVVRTYLIDDVFEFPCALAKRLRDGNRVRHLYDYAKRWWRDDIEHLLRYT